MDSHGSFVVITFSVVVLLVVVVRVMVVQVMVFTMRAYLIRHITHYFSLPSNIGLARVWLCGK